MNAKDKDPKRQLQGAMNKAKGKQFESRLDASFSHYKEQGFAIVEKIPEPMHPTQSLANGKFIAFFAKKAQPDYEGTIKGGKSVMFEAKFTSTDRIEQSRVIQAQADYLENRQKLGALCFVIVGFSSGNAYRIPWSIWSHMKENFGRKYVTEADLDKYQVPTAQSGMLLILD